jgi:hypothetical protein
MAAASPTSWSNSALSGSTTPSAHDKNCWTAATAVYRTATATTHRPDTVPIKAAVTLQACRRLPATCCRSGDPSLALHLFLFLGYGYAGCGDEEWLPSNPNLS